MTSTAFLQANKRRDEKLRRKKAKSKARAKVTAKKADTARNKRVKAAGLVDMIAHYRVHHTRKTEVLWKINLLMHADDYTIPKETAISELEYRQFKKLRKAKGENDAF